MSQLETNPLTNPTILETHPTQQMLVKPPAQIMDLRSTSLFFVRNQTTQFTMEQLDWIKLAMKNKYISTFIWHVSSGNSWFEKEFTIADLIPLIPIGLKFTSFKNFNTVLFSIKPTSNAFFAGLTMLCWDPAPTPSYYADIWNIDLTLTPDMGTHRKFQFNKMMISPKTADEFQFIIGINSPFNFFKTKHVSTGGNPILPRLDLLADYHDRYPLGRIRSGVLSQLNTTSPLTSLSFSLSGQILDLATAGLFINADSV